MPERQRTVRESLRWAFALSWGQRGIRTIFTILLAAILGPETFGIVAMALVYIAFGDLILEQGVTTAIVQRRQLDREHLDAAFWLNLTFSVAIVALSIAFAGWWADVNDVPELQNVVIVLSFTLLIWGLTIVQTAQLQRDLQFQKLALRANAAALLGGLVGLGLALWGAGVWSLVFQHVVIACVSVVLLYAVSDWRPRLRFSRSHAREIFGFSSSVFVANLGGWVNRRGDVLLIGLFFGPTVVGIYRLADRFVDAVLELTLRPVGLVSLPHFARLQHDREALRGTVASFVHLVMLTTLPALLALAACSQYVLGVIGPEWEPGTDAMRLLCVVGIVKGLVLFTGPLLFAVARPLARALTIWIIAAVNVAAIVGVGFALETASESAQLFGVSAVRAIVALVLVVPMNLFIISRLAGLPARTLAPWAVAPVVAGLASIGAVQALSATGLLDDVPAVVALLVAGSLAFLVAGAGLFALEPRARAEVNRLRRALAGSRRAQPLATADEPVPDVDGVDGAFEDLDGSEPARADRGVPYP